MDTNELHEEIMALAQDLIDSNIGPEGDLKRGYRLATLLDELDDRLIEGKKLPKKWRRGP